MDYKEATVILNAAVRSELRDHAFGDREIIWTKDDKQIGGGYFGRGSKEVWVKKDDVTETFTGNEADALVTLGVKVVIERNDETGPDEFTEGDVMPGLSKGDVYHELTGEYLDEKEG